MTDRNAAVVYVKATAIAAPSSPATTAHPRSTPRITAGEGRCQTGARPTAVSADVDPVPGERTQHGREQRLVVLQPPTVEHLQREDRRPEGRAEQHGETGRHPGDRQDPSLGHTEPDASCRERRQRPGRLHERSLRTHRTAGRDAQPRDRKQRTQHPHAGRGTRHVDVVDHQLDVTRRADVADDQAHREPDTTEHDEPDRTRPVRRPQPSLEQVQHEQIAGTDRSGGNAHREHQRHDPDREAENVPVEKTAG